MIHKYLVKIKLKFINSKKTTKIWQNPSVEVYFVATGRFGKLWPCQNIWALNLSLLLQNRFKPCVSSTATAACFSLDFVTENQYLSTIFFSPSKFYIPSGIKIQKSLVRLLYLGRSYFWGYFLASALKSWNVRKLSILAF